jgi:hypothetical protein
VILCKAASSPPGLFTFNVLAVGTIASDVVKSTVQLAAGSCDTVFVRVQAGPVAAAITITESLAANAGVFLQNVTVDGQVKATVGLGVVVTQNLGPDRLVVFLNAQAAIGGTVAFHPQAHTPGIIHLCKSPNSPAGTFTFNITALGLVASDQVVNQVTLTAGTCKVIFIRTQPQLVAATIAVTEQIDLGSLFVLDRILKLDASGQLVIKGSLGVVLTENKLLNGGSLLIFFNKRISLL